MTQESGVMTLRTVQIFVCSLFISKGTSSRSHTSILTDSFRLLSKHSSAPTQTQEDGDSAAVDATPPQV